MRRLFTVSSTNSRAPRNRRTTTNPAPNRHSRIRTVSRLLTLLWVCCFVLISPADAQERQREPLEMSVVVVNPSKTKTQTVPIKMYLPKEVSPDAIINPDGLEIEFDSDQSMYYMYQDEVLLQPAETKIFNVEIADVWIIPQDQLDALAEQTRAIVERLNGTDFYEPAKLLEGVILKSLETVSTTQNDETVSRRSHIGIYRSNLQVVAQVKDDINRLQKQLEIVISSPKPEVLEKSKLKTDSPAKNTTWMIIFIIMLFIGMLGGVFFFTWQTQAHATKDLIDEARESAFPDNEHSGKNPK